MYKLKIFFLSVLLLVLGGCTGSSGSYYVLSLSSQPIVTYKYSDISIGVEKVTVPAYLYKRELAIVTNSSQITFLNGAVWGEDLDEGLTNRVIVFLQKKFNQPNVYAYPWGIDQQPNIKISIQISRFIAQDDNVYLDATWSLENIKTQRRKARLFSTSVPTRSDTQSIVSAMDRAFSQFEETIAIGIKQF